ncbi:hypothetical protein GQ53DRAFT_815623 [Thozetella sp. PMI_491]|nr:hypothetical protein GQ53DRAFT_815623 [Thozetella sp. PMI_491]
MESHEPVPAPHPDAVASVQDVHAQLNEYYPALIQNFEKLYSDWKATWFTGDNEHSASSADRAKGPEWEALLALGPKILPLVVQKLTNEEDFMAVQLYNALEKDIGVKVDPESVLDYLTLQRHANLVVEMNHQRNKTVDEHVVSWQAHQDKHAFSALSTDYVSGEGYENLIGMGEGIIGHVMAKYAAEPDGWWHELIHHIVHGSKAGPGTFFKERLFQEWKVWFENEPHAEAPKGL